MTLHLDDDDAGLDVEHEIGDATNRYPGGFSMKGGRHPHHQRGHQHGCGCQRLFCKVVAKCGCCFARVRGSRMYIWSNRRQAGFTQGPLLVVL
ncbi:unnamed protein product [Arctogadus glacialis]